MQHSIISKQQVGKKLLVNVQLTSDNETEKLALEKVAALNATDEQRQLIDDYLLFQISLAGYVPLRAMSNRNGLFQVEYQML